MRKTGAVRLIKYQKHRRNCREPNVFRRMRYTIRKVTKGWMVWDTSSMKVASVDDMPAIGLSAETAKRFADMLNSQDSTSRSALSKASPTIADGKLRSSHAPSLWSVYYTFTEWRIGRLADRSNDSGDVVDRAARGSSLPGDWFPESGTLLKVAFELSPCARVGEDGNDGSNYR